MSKELGSIGKSVNGVSMALAYGAEYLPGEDGKLRAELTKDGLKDLFRANKGRFTGSMTRAIEQARATVSRRQNLGAEGSLQVDSGKIYDTLMNFVETHIGRDGDPLSLSKSEEAKLGKTASYVVNRSAMPRLAAIDFKEIVRPQEFQMKAAAVREFLLGEAVEMTKDGRYDTYLTESDMLTAVDQAVASKRISKAFGEAAKETFFYAAQHIYRGRARRGWGQRPPETRSICQDMERDFQHALNRLAGDNSSTGAAINAIKLSEAQSYIG